MTPYWSDVFITVYYCPFRTRSLDDKLPLSVENCQRLAPLLRSFQLHHPQLYTENISGFPTSTESVSIETEVLHTKISGHPANTLRLDFHSSNLQIKIPEA